jgi:hypothetical protein
VLVLDVVKAPWPTIFRLLAAATLNRCRRYCTLFLDAFGLGLWHNVAFKSMVQVGFWGRSGVTLALCTG